MIICLIQEDYDAEKFDRKMGKSLLPYAMVRLVMTSPFRDEFYLGIHCVTNHFFYVVFFEEMVLVEGNISPCKHHIHHSIEDLLRLTYVAVFINAKFWSALWSIQT